ncbi:bacillithiol biosynthesis cysteine-adding enzyme BshC [Mangrovimonas aestuarii]|uniref:bacillithiol biosynthesis cysteine-adding enzyme BshC n=1 Tax=Mangrovimonas aestuarii TaxID=3018443 RepID=UPI0023780C24|nr:bacillithiol biosynthesis cysteine-adding enzyme BshC [Mangrovimonas aestuarii]
MPTDCIPFRETNYFSELICDYLDEKETLKPFYNRFPKHENFQAQIEEKKTWFPKKNREVLVKVLKEQYLGVTASQLTFQNIEALANDNSFTITTGHQLNLFTGPLYFLYKIVSTINLTKELKKEYPKYNFVPVYWMATEDHDFDEINFFNFKGKKILWNRDATGAVGELPTASLETVFERFSGELGVGKNADEIRNLFKKAYLKHNNLANATRFLANELFGEYGLVIIDANNTDLKRLFVPYKEMEFGDQTSYKAVSETNNRLNAIPDSNYNIQVNPREINLFYLKNGLRERIVQEGEQFKVLETEISFSENELEDELKNHPERFSPNVIMRPLYQEVILPNLCYIGGGGELAYWLQLKAYFKQVSVPFPMLLLRNSVLVESEKQAEKLQNLGVSNKDIFLKRNELINKKVREISNIDIDFSPQKEHLKQQFEGLYELAEQTDKSFLGAVKAQEQKQIKGLEHLEKRLLKAQKRVLKDEITRMTDLQEELFPGQTLQERKLNFSELYIEYGDRLIQQLMLNLQPLKGEFIILKL